MPFFHTRDSIIVQEPMLRVQGYRQLSFVCDKYTVTQQQQMRAPAARPTGRYTADNSE